MKIDRRRACLALLALPLAACSDGDSLTGPPPGSLIFVYEVRLSVQRSDGSSTLQNTEFLIDGVPLTNQSLVTTSSETVLGGGSGLLAAGTHSGTIRVLAQSTSPGRYALTRIKVSRIAWENGRMVYPWTESERSMNVSAIVETGQSIEFSFTL